MAKDGNSEVILTGRGLGFQAKPGQRIDETKVVRRFVPSDGRDPDHMAELLSNIPPEIIRLVTEAMTRIGMDAQIERRPALVMALADHLTGAIRRINKGVEVEYPLQAEVQSLYAHEYEQAEQLVAVLNSYLGGILPDGEVVAFALHLVNAGFTTGDLTRTYKITGVIQQMIKVIEQSYNVKLDQHSVNVGRFITHLRYLFVRISQNKQLDSEPQPIIDSIKETYADAMRCADKIAAVAALRLDARLTEDEIAYLALHVSRVTADALEETKAKGRQTK
nr:PRD domain-containing protein [Bifidobacterium sp. DSM 109960]